MPADIEAFERTFADLAHASLKSRAPMLMEHMIGWQLVDSSEDETRAVGIFGFKIGEQWVYKPVFFMNGELKGTELLYLKGQDIFVPMQENWINYIVNRRPYVLGETEPYTLEQIGYQPPDFTQYAESPETKRASYDYEGIEKLAAKCQDEWSKDAVRCIFSSDESAPAYEKAAARMDLPTFFKEAGTAAYEAFLECMQADEKFAAAVLQFYDVDDFKDVLPPERSSRDVLSKDAVDDDNLRQTGRKTETGEKYETAHKITGTAPDVIVITPGNNDPNVMGSLDDGEKEQLLRGEIVVQDHRENTSEVFPADVHRVLFSPTENGVYDVLEREGKFNKLVVVNNPRGLRTDSRSRVMLLGPDSGTAVLVHPSSVFASKRYYDESWLNVWDGLSKSDTVQRNNTYVFIGPSGDATAPLSVNEVKKDDKGRTYLDVNDDYEPVQGGREYIGGHFQDTHRRYNRIPYHGKRTNTAVLGGVKSQRLRTSGDTLFIPDEYKVIKINREFTTREQIDPGTMADLTLAISKTAGMLPLKVYDDGSNIHLSSGSAHFEPLSKLAALRTLIIKWGMKKDTAVELLKDAELTGGHKKRPVRVNVLMKTAQGYGQAEIPPNRVSNDLYAPYSMNQADYNKSFDALLGIEAQHPYVSNTEVRVPQDPPPLQPYRANAEYGNPMQGAAQAAQAGQKEVFDISTVSRLTKMVDVAELVDKYQADLVNGMDRVGRILFVFYWHYEKFSERYGKEDLPELEDSLKGVFKQLGDLILFLKQKSIEPEVNIGLPLMAGVSE